MENQNSNKRGRRRRRGGGNMCGPLTQDSPCERLSGCLNLIYNFMVMALLISVIYMMLDYHCTTCSKKCNSSAKNITRHIQEIADNINIMKNNYKDLQKKITYLSHELPRLEGQIDTLESLTSGLGDSNWNIYKTPLCAPHCNSDVFKPIPKGYCYGLSDNCDRNCTKKPARIVRRRNYKH